MTILGITLSGWLSAIGGIATIAGAVYGVFKWVAWKAQKTPDQINQKIDQDVQDERHQAEESGRPV
jgi:hypothetical protein